MLIKKIDVSPIGTNCYIVAEEKNRKADEKSLGMVIDPGGDGEKLESFIKDNNIHLKYIVLTHGHFDHIGASEYLKQQFGAEVLVHRLDSEMVADPNKNLSIMFMGSSVSVKADKLLEDEEMITLGDLNFKILHTPGHSPGGICLLSGNVLFSGDTLFQGAVGRTDGPGGSMRTLLNSIKTKLIIIDESCIVYPGHGEYTTIGEEKRMNQFLRNL